MMERFQPEPIWMDENFLQKAIQKKIDKDKNEKNVPVKDIKFHEIYELCLEHRNIGKIDDLMKFTSLARLDLNSNRIEMIVGLECLVNLTWLNLSFNCIQKIEGLESLQKLELLNLSNNKISVIENMDSLEKLTNFLFANNLIHKLNNVLYLRKFKNLFSVNLSGNPISKEDGYKYFITAFFPNLQFLDQTILDNITKKKATIKYHTLMEEMKHEELQMKQAHEAEQSRKAELKLHRDAFVEFLNGSDLFKSMFQDDPEAETLHSAPEVAHLLQTFEHQFLEQCIQLFEIGLAKHKQRETEVKSFSTAQNQAVTDYQQQASDMLADFELRHKERIAELQQLSDPDQVKDKINYCNDEINQLCKSLMALEFQLVSQLEDSINKLENNISEMVGNFTETAQGIFAQCRDLEDDYNEKLRQICVATLENVAQEKLDLDLPDDARTLFEDKDTVMDALVTSHDNHLLKIHDREIQLVTSANAWKEALFKEIQDNELKQNRMRITDIYRYADHLRKQLEEFQ